MKKAALLLAGILAFLFCFHSSGGGQETQQLPSMPGLPLIWNTFLGSGSYDEGYCIIADTAGNTYVVGTNYAGWGSPLRPYGGGPDAFVAKLDANGTLQWHTFLGGASSDAGFGLALDTNGNIYATGRSSASWGLPVNPHTGGLEDAFVAKLDANGILQWNTFLGGLSSDVGHGIVADTSGNIYLIGYSYTTWGAPLLPFAAEWDAFVAKLDANGILQWNTFLGGPGQDVSQDIAMDTSGNVYISGSSNATWGFPVTSYTAKGDDILAAKLDSVGIAQWPTFIGGSPVDSGDSPFKNGIRFVTGASFATSGLSVNPNTAGDEDAFVAKLDANGTLQWHTFLGGLGSDAGRGVALDTSGNIYITGASFATWGSPANPYTGSAEGFVAKLNADGILQWNTFLGGASSYDFGTDLAIDANENSYVSGTSESGGWGSPLLPFAGDVDAFLAKLDANGILQWHAFLGSDSYEYGSGVDTNGDIYVTGSSNATWGSPVNPFTGFADTFVAKISMQPPYTFFGFDQPIENPPIINNARASSAISVRWRITELDGTPISDPASFKSLTSYGVSCVSFAATSTDEVKEYSAGSSGLQYLGDGYWQFNWKTLKSYTGRCRIMVLRLADGSEHTALFHFKDKGKVISPRPKRFSVFSLS